jgi:hypothetical protein
MAHGRTFAERISRPWHQLRDRVSGPAVKRPIASTAVFAVAFGAYATLLAVSLVTVAADAPIRGSVSAGVEGISVWTVPVLVTSLAGWVALVQRAEQSRSLGVPWLRPRSLVAGVLYVGLTNAGAVGFGPAFLGATVLHAGVLVFLYEVYATPLVPDAPDATRKRRAAYLELHLTNWWRITQVVVSLGIALGIGLIAQFYLSVQQGASILFLLAFAGPLTVGLALHLLYLLWKIHAIERAVRNEQMTG